MLSARASCTFNVSLSSATGGLFPDFVLVVFQVEEFGQRSTAPEQGYVMWSGAADLAVDAKVSLDLLGEVLEQVAGDGGVEVQLPARPALGVTGSRQ
jgi:hypothetical protein